MMKTSRSCSPPGLLAFVSLLGSLSSACVTEDVDPVATGGSSGAATGSGGTPGGNTGGNATGGRSGSGGAPTGIQADPAFAMGTRCYAIGQALMMDFNAVVPAPVTDAGAGDGGADAAVTTPPPVANTTGASFGDFTSNFSGSTFIYPGDGMWPVTSDVTENNWHISGSIGTYSGFGVSFSILNAGCNLVDASDYDGISFTVRGNVALMPSVNFSVGQASNDVSHLWINTQPTPPATPAAANFGRCIPASANQFDGSCGAPATTIPVTATETTIDVLWTDLAAGRPAAMLNPAEITGFAWNVPPPVGAGTATPTPYQADVYIDNLSFIER